MAFQLRPYQDDIVNKARALMRSGVHSMILCAPTGSGKTALAAHMLHTSASRGMDSWFSVHRRELIKQSIRAFHLEGIRAGIVAANFPADPRARVQIASIQTLARRYPRLRAPKLIVWDECHHIAAGSWAKIHAAFPNAFHIGLTATPERLDGKGLREWFKEIVQGPSVSWLIENKFLAPYKLFAPGGINTESIKTTMGDFSKPELAAASDKPTITGNAIQHYLKHARGQRAIVSCVSIEHSKHVVSQFLAAGISAAHVDGDTDANERDRKTKSFENGETLVLSNVDLFGEGYDVPAAVVAILLRPTQSKGLFLQQCGRVLRPSPGKSEAIILDHAGNTQQHGLPCEERDWTLDGRGVRSRADQESNVSVRICNKCFAAQAAFRKICKFCGATFEINPREVEQIEGELVEVDPAIIRATRMREQGRAQTVMELAEIGKRRGYKQPFAWASHVFRARQAQKLREGRVG